MNRNLMRRTITSAFLLMITSMALLTSHAHAAPSTPEERQIKKDKDNTASVKTELNRAQAQLDGGSTKIAVTSLRNAKRYFGRLSASALESTEVSTLKAKLEELTKAVDIQVAKDKQLKRDERAITTTKKYLLQGQTYLESAYSLASTRRALNTAIGAFAKISESGQKMDASIELKRQLDDLVSATEAAEAQDMKNREHTMILFNLRSLLSEYIKKNPIIFDLQEGKGGTDTTLLSRLKYIKENYDGLTDKEAKFKQQFAPLIEADTDTPDTSRNSPAIILELFKNKEKYRNAFVRNIGENKLNKQLNILTEVEQKLESDYPVQEWVLNILYGPQENEVFDVVREISPYYDWAGIPLPEEKLKTLADYKPKIRKLIEAQASKARWDEEKYGYSNAVIEKAAKKGMDSMTFIKAAITGNDDWYIHKNALGIPLYKVVKGFALYKHKGEPFKRGYVVRFFKTYNGNGFEPTPRMELHSNIYAFK